MTSLTKADIKSTYGNIDPSKPFTTYSAFNSSYSMETADQDLFYFQKQLELINIKCIVAPAIAASQSKLVKQHDDTMDSTVEDGQETLTSLAERIEEYLKGKASDSVKESANTLIDSYDDV